MNAPAEAEHGAQAWASIRREAGREGTGEEVWERERDGRGGDVGRAEAGENG
jgi:hypothetical protein